MKNSQQIGSERHSRSAMERLRTSLHSKSKMGIKQENNDSKVFRTNLSRSSTGSARDKAYSNSRYGNRSSEKRATQGNFDKSLLMNESFKKHKGSFKDHRFNPKGGDDPLEVHLVNRFAKEKQRRFVSGRTSYTKDQVNRHFGSSDVELTHGGKSLSEAMNNCDIIYSSDDQALSSPKTKAEIMQDIIAKSKEYKAEKRKLKEQDADEIYNLDTELQEIQTLLPRSQRKWDVKQDNPITNDSYDLSVKQLVFDRRSKPANRTKTEREMTKVAAEQLEKLEEERLKRMESNTYSEKDLDLFETDIISRLENKEETRDDCDLSDLKKEHKAHEIDKELFIKREFFQDIDLNDASVAFVIKLPETRNVISRFWLNYDINKWPLILRRILTYYHPSLRPESKVKLGKFLEVFVTTIFKANGHVKFSTVILDKLFSAIFQMKQYFATDICKAFHQNLSDVSKNINYFFSDLLFFDIMFRFFSSSDFKHAFLSPARLCLCRYIIFGKPNSEEEIYKRLWASNIILNSDRDMERLSPEIFMLMGQVFSLLLPPSTDSLITEKLFPSQKLDISLLRIGKLEKQVKDEMENSMNFFDLRFETLTCEAKQQIILHHSSDILKHLLQRKNSSVGIVIIWKAFEKLLDDCSRSEQWEACIVKKNKDYISQIRVLLGNEITKAEECRQFLKLQNHGPKAMRLTAPKFETAPAGNLTYLGKSRDEIEHLRVKKEYQQTKSVMQRNIRRNAQFSAQQKSRMRRTKDAIYEQKMRIATRAVSSS